MKDAAEKKKVIQDRRKGDSSDLTRPFRMSADDKLRRLERIERNDSTRHLRDYSLERARRLEDFELKTNPHGFERRNRDHGLDAGTECKLEFEKKRQDLKHRDLGLDARTERKLELDKKRQDRKDRDH